MIIDHILIWGLSCQDLCWGLYTFSSFGNSCNLRCQFNFESTKLQCSLFFVKMNSTTSNAWFHSMFAAFFIHFYLSLWKLQKHKEKKKMCNYLTSISFKDETKQRKTTPNADRKKMVFEMMEWGARYSLRTKSRLTD